MPISLNPMVERVDACLKHSDAYINTIDTAARAMVSNVDKKPDINNEVAAFRKISDDFAFVPTQLGMLCDRTLVVAAILPLSVNFKFTPPAHCTGGDFGHFVNVWYNEHAAGKLPAYAPDASAMRKYTQVVDCMSHYATKLRSIVADLARAHLDNRPDVLPVIRTLNNTADQLMQGVANYHKHSSSVDNLTRYLTIQINIMGRKHPLDHIFFAL